MKSEKLTRACVLALAAMGWAFGATAETVVWNGGSNGRWNDPLSYAGGVADGPVPGVADEVQIPANTTINVDVTDTESFAVFAGVYRIQPMADTSILVFDVPANVTSVVHCAINYDSWSNGNKGYVVKKGAGGLQLSSYTLYNNNGNSNYRDNYLNYRVEEGTLILPQDTTTEHNSYYGYVAISNGATVVMESTSSSANKAVHTYMLTLDGDGDVVDLYNGSASHTLRVTMGGTFSGRLTENVRWYGSGNVNLTGTNSTMANGFQHYYNASKSTDRFSGVDGENASQGIIGIMKFGKTGQPSSIGANAQLGTRDYGCVIRYLGEGETTDKTLFVWDTGRAPVVLDAGAVGGLVWDGTWTQNTGKTANRSNHRLVLTGSNTVPCVFSGQLNSATFTDPETVQTNYDFYISKYGSGTWRFADNTNNAANRTFAGGIAVHEGVLQFDSINEKGVVSSLGTSTNLHADQTGPATLPQVDYAYVLGGGANVATAVFEHVGWDLPPTAANAATNRPIVLNGRGTIRANGSYLGLSGIRGMSAGNHTLVLDGTTTVNNVVCDIEDGPSGSTVSVEKTGPGKWALGRKLTFSGSLDVKEGTLAVRPCNRYSWYRWTIKANISTAGGSSEGLVMAQELALFNSSGMRQNLGFTMNSNITTLAAGQIGLDTEYSYWTREVTNALGVVTNWRQLDCLCDDAKTDPGWMIQSYGKKGGTSGSYPPRPAKPDSWLPITMRLLPDADTVTSWDWAYNINSSRSIVPRLPKLYILEGSVDGLHWDRLSTHDDSSVETWEPPTTPLAAWRFGGDEFYAGRADRGHAGGETIPSAPATIYSQLEDVTAISVSAGARLEVDGGTIALPAGITLNLDASAGGGTLAGFTLPANGTLNLANYTRAALTEIPLAIEGGGETGATGWTAAIDGVATRRRVKFSATAATVFGLGTTLSFR